MARVQGVEPQPSDPETDVLPLDDTRVLFPNSIGIAAWFQPKLTIAAGHITTIYTVNVLFQQKQLVRVFEGAEKRPQI